MANCAIELGMEVYGYDPYISIEAAWNLSSQVHHCVNLNDMLPLCDYITIHVPYLPTTKDTINAQTLALCKDGVKILNYARGELVNTAALLEAMDTGKVSGYMTDFPSEAILGKPGIVCTPHLGASTPEAEDNCAIITAIHASNPDLLWIGMTAPKQEKWTYSHWSELDIHCHVGTIGAVFDFFAGTVARAPLWWQNHGLEWLYRLLKEPRRMWRRYILGNTLFLKNMLIEKLSK